MGPFEAATCSGLRYGDREYSWVRYNLMRFLSRAQRWTVWTVCSLAVLVSLFALVLPWSTRYLVDRIAVLLSDRYDIDFSTGRVEFALRSLSFTLHDVRLATGGVPESATVVAKRVNLDLSTAALRGALAFDRIEIVDPSVSWIAGGPMPASRLPHTTRTDSRPVITVGRLDVVNLEATASSLRLTGQGLSASLRGDAEGRLVGEIHAGRGIRLEAENVAGMLPRAGLRARKSAVALLHRPDVLRVLIGGNQNRRPMPM